MNKPQSGLKHNRDLIGFMPTPSSYITAAAKLSVNILPSQHSSVRSNPSCFLVMSFFWAFSLLALSLPSVNAAPSVTIAAGTIHGMTCTNGASAFLSIPYAVPPVGDLRWTAPQAYDQKFPSTGYSATTKGAACIQFGSQFLETGTTSEDCLFIDVWVPPNAKKSSNLPVKVFIYGGGEQAGGIQDALYDGCNLAAHDTLLVSINYRLGPIGYMTLESAGIAGNFGIQDLVLGLEWVQTNIAAFGGNPVSLRTQL